MASQKAKKNPNVTVYRTQHRILNTEQQKPHSNYLMCFERKRKMKMKMKDKRLVKIGRKWL